MRARLLLLTVVTATLLSLAGCGYTDRDRTDFTTVCTGTHSGTSTSCDYAYECIKQHVGHNDFRATMRYWGTWGTYGGGATQEFVLCMLASLAHQ
jgi:hypothetical protein